MRRFCSFLIGLILIFLAIGCVSKGKKESDNPNNTPARSALKPLEPVVPPLLLTDPQARIGFVITHYWEKFDFRDTMYCHAPEITEQAFANFINLLYDAPTGKVSEAIHKLLDSAQVDEVMYNYFIKLAEHYLYHPNSPMQNEEFYIPFLEHIVASPQVMDVAKIRPQQLLELAYRNRPGAKAEDIVYTTPNGKTGRLYAISARYVLLMFHNPGCKECVITTSELKKSSVITAAITSGQLKVLAVYPDEDLESWRNHLNDMPSSWINGYDKDLVIRNSQTYDLKAIPTLYLLDENKNVILKDIPVAQIHDFLAQNR